MGRDNFVAPTVGSSKRPPIPDILGAALAKDRDAGESIEIQSALSWDYQQLGSNAPAAIEHTVAIKKSERRASEAIIEAGQHLIAMKGMLNHGQWGDWLRTEFAMSEQTAWRMMQVAEKFDSKSLNLGTLKPSVLYMLAADNVPEPAREQVIQEAQQTRPTIRRVREVIEQHTPRPEPAKPAYTPVAIAGDEPQQGTPIPPRAAVLNTPPAATERPFFSLSDAHQLVRDAAREYFTTPDDKANAADRIRFAAQKKSRFWQFVAGRWPHANVDGPNGPYAALLWVAKEIEEGKFSLVTAPPAPVVTLDELEVVDSVTAPVQAEPVTPAADPDEVIESPFDCYDDDETPDVYEGFTETDQETFDRLKWPRRMRDLHELKMWLKTTRDEKAREYAKLTGQAVPTWFTEGLDHMIATLETTMDTTEQEAVANVAA